MPQAPASDKLGFIVDGFLEIQLKNIISSAEEVAVAEVEVVQEALV